MAGTGKLFIDPPENSKQHVADPLHQGAAARPFFLGVILAVFALYCTIIKIIGTTRTIKPGQHHKPDIKSRFMYHPENDEKSRNQRK